ncbi:MAG TPA: fibronectin-binding protein (FBP) [Firmicutes bacterium]|nr:fibronectin-binding protein (FBP) [Bacillota bacterium]
MSEEIKGENIKKEKHIIKGRDDHYPVYLEQIEKNLFKLCPESRCSWLKDEGTVSPFDLRRRIEPWLTALFQSEYLSLLIGSGLTHSVYRIAQNSQLPGMGKIKFDVFNEQINQAASSTAKNAGRKEANIEDQIRVANELLLGLEHYCTPCAQSDGPEKLKQQIGSLREEISQALRNFAATILNGERHIASASQREKAFDYLVNFLMSFASRSGTRDRLHIFTTNYDRLIEAGAEIAGLHLLDRFVGNLAPLFRSSRLNIDMHYNPPGIRGEPRYLEGVARFTKLHGSVDWIYAGRDIRRMGLPFGSESVEPYFKAPGLNNATALDLIIYPNSAKDRETAAYPYVELFRDFAAAVCRPNNTLVTYGYSFGDEHINRVIEDMLTIPSTHLVIISYDDSLDRIRKTYEKVARPAQTTLLIGSHLGSLDNLVNYYLPKPSIDRITFKMSKLLAARFGTEQVEKDDKDHGQGGRLDELKPV